MVKWVLIALATLKGFLDGHAADVHLADVGQENADRQKRSVELLDPDSQATRDRWNATLVSNHGRLFPFSDNWTTLMFIVASDLSETQRERDAQVPFLFGE